MKKFISRITLLSCVALFIFTVNAQKPTVTLNGTPIGVFTSTEKYSVNNSGYVGNPYTSSVAGAIELKISGAPANCSATIQVYRTDNSFSPLTVSVPVYSNSPSNDLVPWGTPNSPVTGDYSVSPPSVIHFYEAASGTAIIGDWELGDPYSGNLNKAFGVILGQPGHTTRDSYYKLVISFSLPGAANYDVQEAEFIMQPTDIVMNMSANILNTGSSTSCSSRATNCKAYFNTPHFSKACTLSAQLYKNGSTFGSPYPYTAPGPGDSGYSNTAGAYPTLDITSFSNITTNGV